MKWHDAAYYGKMILFFLTMFVGVFLLSGCKTSYVPMEKVVCRDVVKARTDTLWRTDSVWQKDSVMVTMKGDTVYRDRWQTKLRYLYINKVKTDTLIRTDTVRVSVVASDKKKDDALVTIRLGKYSVWTLIVGIVWFLIWRIKKLRLWQRQ